MFGEVREDKKHKQLTAKDLKVKPDRQARSAGVGGVGAGRVRSAQRERGTPGEMKQHKATETPSGQTERQHLTGLHADGPTPA